MRPSFFHHLHPPTIPAAQSRFRYTLGAGGISLFLVFVLFLTGVLLMFYYIPTPQDAGPSIQTITYLVPFGALVRNLHYWTAQILIVVVLIHMARVILTGAYARPRRFNYLLGLALLVLCLFLDFSGYVLRWDEGIRWALIAGTNLILSIPAIGPSLYAIVMGGSQPGPATLTRFYTWHIFGLVAVLAFLVGWHLFRVRRDGGIAAPPRLSRQGTLQEETKAGLRITRFELVRREGLAAILSLVPLLLVSTFLPAPLAPPMQDTAVQLTDAHAPWFFLWVQQMLKWGQPFWMGVVVPVTVLCLIGSFPYVLPNAHPEELGRWFPRGSRITQVILLLLSAGALVLTILAYQATSL